MDGIERTIKEPGIYDMPAEQYHADPCPEPSLSSHIAWTLIDRSPRHAWTDHPKLNPRHESEEKTAFDKGSAAHALLLEGVNRMQIIHADSYRKKEAQEARDAARAAGKHPVLAADYALILEMKMEAERAISECSDLSGIMLKDGKPERTFIWQERGIWLRCRPDWIADSLALMLDYKTTTSAEPGYFGRQISRMGYHFQAAFYRRGVKAVTGRDVPFILLAQEIDPPQSASFHGCAPTLMQIAEDRVEAAIDLWARCLKADRWPTYSSRVHYHEAAGWQMMEHEERLAAGIPYDIEKFWKENRA